uniref:WASH complex subunit 3 n=1 Tax=Cryptomonas curvata TaxID=233186 RepID=A0A7S0M7Z7_9CRYP|mmetsp:Transcript_27464/g.57101  ORF Transcript_27464/g.57101 Transcript_27464/m.57101 type:complete len:218 (+) Transcript_27464:23-676(+)
MESKIDLSQVTPVNYKVTVVLVNQFAVTTIQFLNRFSSQCEEKLRYVSEGIYRVNAGLDLLEAKLDSIPFLNNDQDARTELANEKTKDEGSNVVVPTSAITDGNASSQGSVIAFNVDTVRHSPEPVSSVTQAQVQQGQEESAGSIQTVPSENFVKLKDDLRFTKYFRMVKMGVPPAAVKGKMSMEGADPSVLDLDPESPAPEGAVTSLPSDNSDDSD